MLSGWTKSLNISLYNSTTTLTDYQVKFVIYRSSGTNNGDNIYLGIDCQSNYGDIRFTSTSDVEYSYWIESYDASSATVWVKIPSLTGSAYTDIVLQYGNSSATTTSNGSNTFVFFDHFEGSSLDTGKWTATAGSPSIGSSLCTLNISSGYETITSVLTSFTCTSHIVETRASFSLGSVDNVCEMGMGGNILGANRVAGNVYGLRTYNNSYGGPQDTNVGASYTGYHIWGLKYNGSGILGQIDRTTIATHTTYYFTTAGSVVLSARNNTTAVVDWILVRQYSAVEPTKYYPRNLSEWTYRKSHTITHTSITDYQTRIRVYRTTGTDSAENVYVGDKCRADFGDIRFTNSAGTELSYWMETNATTYADFWVKLDSITTSATFYIYYGNSSATSISNGDTTFTFFDDFINPASALNTSKWTTSTGTVSVTEGLVTCTNTALTTSQGIRSGTSYGAGSALLVKFSSTPNTTNNFPEVGFSSWSTAVVGVSGISGAYQGYTYNGTQSITSLLTRDTSSHRFDIQWLSSSLCKFSVDNGSYSSITTNIPTSSVNVSIRPYTSTSTYLAISCDYIAVRQINATDVTHTAWGTEELLKSPLTNWAYRQSHVINGSVTDYQIKLTLQYSAGTSSSDTVYLNNHARPDFGDVRFTDNSGNLLSYWIESYTGGSSATVWVKIPTISGDTTIYVYYGNATAGTTSNGNTTFPFFDDFDGNSLNPTKWNSSLISYNSGTGTATVNGTVTVTQTGGSTGGIGLSTLNQLGSDSAYRIRAKVNARSSGAAAQARIVLTSTAADPGVFGIYNNSAENRCYLHQGFGIGNPYISDTFVTSTPTIYDFECKVANPKLYKDNTLVITGTGTPTAPLGTYIRIWVYGTTASITVDYILARSYAATEPIHGAWGAEQNLSATSFIIQITPTSGSDPLSVTYNCVIPEGTLTNFTLNYGDGNEYTNASQSSFSTSHVYSEPGTYTVWGEGYNEFATHVYYEIPYGVTVTAPAVVASFTISQSYNTITFTNTSTGNINECYWTFGDGSYSYETNPTHTYYTTGSYTPTLYTSNQYQYSSATSAVTITQIQAPPSAYFIPARLDVVNPTLPYTVTFTNLSTPNFGCTYNWTVDGGSVSTSQNPSISFATHGVYDIGLTVANAMGSSSRVYNDAIRLTRKSRTMNEMVGGADAFASFGVQVFLEYATGTDLPIVYATILPEGVYFVQREIPDVPGIDEWGVRHLYSTINEWGVRIFTTLNSLGYKILHNASSVDRTPLKCIDVEIFEEVVNVSDDHQFDETP